MTMNWEDCDRLPWLMQDAKGRAGAVPSNKLFVDVGANIGACSIMMAALGHAVVSFEPVPATFAALAAGMAANRFGALGTDVRLVNAGVSDEVGTSVIYSPQGHAGRRSRLQVRRSARR